MKTLTVPTTTTPVATTTTASTSVSKQASPAAPRACAHIARTLSFGARGDDVKELQMFLVGTGDLASDSATGYFGALTRVAVRAYQAREGIVSDGDERTTGWGMVGARTRVRVACGGENTRGAALSASLSGLTATVQATVNTRNSCAAATYALDYGDRTSSEMAVSANLCAPLTRSFTHTYSAPGAYTLALTSGALRVTLPITVAERTSCSPPRLSASSDVPRGVVGTPYMFSFASFSESTQSSTQTPIVASSLPPGITLVNQASSTATSSNSLLMRWWSLSGTPTQAGSFISTISAVNTCGTSTLKMTIPISSISTTVSPAFSCSSYNQQLVCGAGYSIRLGGYDTNGCMLPATCVREPVSCPAIEYQMPQCAAWQHVETSHDGNGCALPPQCVANTAILNAQPQSGNAPLTVVFSWDPILAPSSIDFGDGTLGSWQDGIPSSIGHTYTRSGTYTAVLYKHTCDSSVCTPTGGGPLVSGVGVSQTMLGTATIHVATN